MDILSAFSLHILVFLHTELRIYRAKLGYKANNIYRGPHCNILLDRKSFRVLWLPTTMHRRQLQNRDELDNISKERRRLAGRNLRNITVHYKPLHYGWELNLLGVDGGWWLNIGLGWWALGFSCTRLDQGVHHYQRAKEKKMIAYTSLDILWMQLNAAEI